MALRLTGTSQPAPSAQVVPQIIATSLATIARSALDRGDMAPLHDAFAEAAGLPDPHRRFEAQLALLETGFDATRHTSDAISLRIFVALAERALEILEEDPAQPVLLNYAAVALYELWSLDGAHALFRAARRLDPGLADAERNLAALDARRRAGRQTRPLHAAVPGLARRADAVARRARPATGLTLSLCMIVRDEEQMLPRCLAAVAPAVDEIVVVDTGSVDSTVEIARSFGARVIEFPWTGSFAEARNVSFEAATGDWLIYLDADEILVEADAQRLRTITGRTWREAFYLVETNHLGELGEGSAMVNNALRVFRNRPAYRFTDRLHEQIYGTLPSYLPMRFEQTTVRVEHYGYLGAVRSAKDKSRRNIELLREQAAGSADTPFLHFNLGSEYAAAGDAAAAAAELETARWMLSEQGDLATAIYAPALLLRLVTALRQSGQLSAAEAAGREALEILPDFTDIVLAQARTAEAAGDPAEARRLYERCLAMGDAPAVYGPMIGSGTYVARLGLAALDRSQGDLDAARAHIEWCVEHHPEFLAIAGPYATVLLETGETPASVSAALQTLGELPGRARIAVGEAFRRAGHPDAAIGEYRRALDAAPHNTEIRTALGELLLVTGSFDAASEVVADVPVSHPYAALAARILLIATIGRADRDATEAALQRARQAGVPAGEQAVFAHWIALAHEIRPPSPVGAAGAPLLTVILQTLLGAGDGARFVSLLPALHSCEVDEREKRETLGQMFLDHGLLDRAAEQWMAVCAIEPDARALLGLARVAQRSGMTKDAATFATSALELDPGMAAAEQLLAGLEPVAHAAVA